MVAGTPAEILIGLTQPEPAPMLFVEKALDEKPPKAGTKDLSWRNMFPAFGIHPFYPLTESLHGQGSRYERSLQRTN